jgi:hypothetical protein
MGLFSKKDGAPLSGADAVRRVDEQAAAAFEQALGQLGQVVHAVDPNRGISFAAGGPPVWSVGFVSVAGPRPYTLAVTYGLSSIITPESGRPAIDYELSIAVPAGEPVSPWADAFLRAQAHYILTQRVDLNAGDCVRFGGGPITRLAFAPEHHAMLPDTTLVGMLVAVDPVVPVVRTPVGDIAVRRLVGIDGHELDRAQTWDPAAFLELVRAADPLLLSPLQRPSYLAQPAFRDAIEPRAQRDGSTVEALPLDMAWQQYPQQRTVRITLPQGPVAQRALNALRGRVGFGRKLVAFGTTAPITFVPGPAGMDITAQGLELAGELTTPPISMIVDALQAGAPYLDLAIQPPPPARARAQFFARIATVTRTYESNLPKLASELRKLLDEAPAIVALGAQVQESERDADRAALAGAIRTLRFARSPDQSVIEPLIQTLSRG